MKLIIEIDDFGKNGFLATSPSLENTTLMTQGKTIVEAARNLIKCYHIALMKKENEQKSV